MSKRPGILLFGVLLSVTALCAQTREPGTVATEPTFPSGTIPVVEPQYARDSFSTAITATHADLGPGDLLEITVFDTPELSQRVRVNASNKIALSLIGEVSVQGMAAPDLASTIRQKLIGGHFVKDPQVTVFVAEYAGQVVYVTGEVNHPGAYPLLRAHRLQDLIAAAGGLTARAGNMVTVAQDSSPGLSQRFDLQDKDSARANPDVSPGDRIVVGLAGIVYVLGDVGRPGGFLIDRRSKLTVLQALALAEGPTQTASLTKASLIHSDDPNTQPIPINIKSIVKAQSTDVQLQAGDILWVSTSQTRNLGRLVLSTVLATASGVTIYTAYGH